MPSFLSCLGRILLISLSLPVSKIDLHSTLSFLAEGRFEKLLTINSWKTLGFRGGYKVQGLCMGQLVQNVQVLKEISRQVQIGGLGGCLRIYSSLHLLLRYFESLPEVSLE